MSVEGSLDKLVNLEKQQLDADKEKTDLDRQIEEVDKQKQQLEDKRKELETKREADLEAQIKSVDTLIAEMKEKDKLPTHERVSEIYSLCKNGEAVNTCIALTHRALESFNPDEAVLDISDPTKVTFIENVSEVNTTEGEPGKPQVFVKKIQKEQFNWLGMRHRPRKFEDTDEVMVIVKLNNDPGNDPRKITVVEAVVKTTKTAEGHDAVRMALSDPGIYAMESLEQYSEGRFSDNPSYHAKLRRGDMTIEDYQASYRKEHGETLHEYHKKRDARLEKDPNYTNSRQEREDFIESIPDRYTHLLEDAQNFRDETQAKLEEHLKQKQENFENVRHDETFLVLAIDIVKLIEQDAGRIARGERPLHAKRIQNAKAAILRFYPDLTMAELERITG